MNLGEIKAQAASLLGDTAMSVYTSSDHVNWANYGQFEVARRTGILRVTASINAVDGQENYTLPSNFISGLRVTYQGVVLKRTSLKAIDMVFPDRDVTLAEGTPQYFWYDGMEIFLYPRPDANVTSGIKVRYIRTPNALANDADTPEIPTVGHPLLVEYNLIRGKHKSEDFDQAELLKNRLEPWLAEIDSTFSNPQADSYAVVQDYEQPDIYNYGIF